MMPESAPYMSPQSKPKRPLVWMIVTAVLVLALGGLAAVYYLQTVAMKDKTSNLQSQVDTANAQVAAKQKQLDDKAAAAADDSTVYREIPEIGVKYKLTEANKDVTYAYLSGDSKSAVIGFSTVEIAGGIKVTDKKTGAVSYPCSGANAPLGVISKYVDGSTEVGVGPGMTAAAIGKKIGGAYYVYQSPQAACSADTSLDSQQSAGVKDVKAIYDSLTAM